MINGPKECKMSDEMLERNLRVKTASYRKNEGRMDSFEDKDMAYDDLSEADFIYYSRKTVKKNDFNRKFRVKTKPN
jgi:hypothetical protein